MPWAHPFTSVISGPTGSGKSVFVRKFDHNIQHMMMPSPDKISWCYDVYQPLYGTVDRVEFVQGLPDFNTLDPAEKTLDHHKRPDGRRGPESGQSVHQVFVPQELERHAHRSEPVQQKNVTQDNQSKYPLHGTVQEPQRHVTDHGASTPNISQENAFFLEAFARATAKPHVYMVIDMKQDTPDIL